VRCSLSLHAVLCRLTRNVGLLQQYETKLVITMPRSFSCNVFEDQLQHLFYFIWHVQTALVMWLIFTARCTIVLSAVCDRISSVCPSICPSVTLVDHDHTGWKSWKLIERTISPTSSLFVAQRSFTHSQGNMEKILGKKCTFNTYANNVRLN